MSGTHSTTMAEERLHPSTQPHKSTFTAVTTSTRDSTTNTRHLDSTTIGEGPGHVPPLAAFEVSKPKRLLQICVAVIYCLLAAGVVFGYAALKPILVAENVYREYCTPEEEEEGVRVCYQQELRLNFMFTVAAVATNVCALLVGTILDQWGPRFAGIIGSILFAAGIGGFAVAKDIVWFDAYPIAYLLMAVGGPFIFIPSFHLANAFPQRSGLILSMLTGAFDASSAVFLLYRLLYQHTESGVSLRTWFSVYMFVPVFILLAQVFIMPSASYKTASELSQQAAVETDLLTHDSITAATPEPVSSINHRRERRASLLSEIDSLLGAPNDREKIKTQKHENSGVWGAMHNKPVSAQLSSFWFWGIAGFTIVQMTRINYFVATIRPQYEFLLHSYPASVAINGFFDIALPLGGLAAIPFIGMVLDSFSVLTVLSILVSVATTIGILGLIENSYFAAYANILLFVAYRPFYYTVVSDYCVKVFGIKTFGKIYGAVICLAGLFNFSQAAMDTVTYRYLGGDPRPVNAGLLGCAVIVGVALVFWVWKKGKQVRRWKLSEEAREAGEAERLWRGVDGEAVEGYGAV